MSLFSGFAAGALGSVAQIGSTMLGIRAQKKENAKAFRNQVSMWNAQNEYNSPKEQMQRLKEAGLNPMLVYGNGSVSGNMSASAPSYEPVNYTGAFSDLGKAIGSAAQRQLAQKRVEFEGQKLNQDLQLGQEQIEQVRANTKLLASSVLRNEADTFSILHNLALAQEAGVGTTSKLKDFRGFGRKTVGDFTTWLADKGFTDWAEKKIRSLKDGFYKKPAPSWMDDIIEVR